MPSLHKRLAALCDNSSSDSDAKVPGDADSKLISYAFLNVPYIDDFTGMLKRFSAHLCNAAVEFAADRDSNGKRLIAPYVAVVQSSGFGKSRLLFEFSKRHLSFFICTRDKGRLDTVHFTPTAHFILLMLTEMKHI